MSAAVRRPAEPPPLDWQDAATVAQVRAAIASRRIFRGRAGPIELVQTHISTVFLTPRHVFKFKRPLDAGFVDCRTLRARLHFCRAEVRLNRRLAPDVYLGIAPLRRREGRLVFGSRGSVVDYAVVMRRLPADRMLDARLKAGTVSPEDMDALAETLGRFHRRLRPAARLARYGSLATWRRNWDENFAQTLPEVELTLSRASHAALRERVFGFMARHARLFRERVRGGFVRNGHGDLRCEHIALDRPIRIIDCVEFSERFRCGDTANDLAFLLMDLCAFGQPALAERLVQGYRARTGDAGLLPLLPFYGCYRAFVRGKVLGMRLRDRNLPPAARRAVTERARAFFALAEAFARQMGPPVLVAVCGLMGSGKSTLAGALAARTGMAVLNSDRIRKELAAGPGLPFRDRSAFGAGLYSAAWTERTYAAMFAQARERIASGQSVILDASFSDAAQRRRAFALAKRAGAEAFLVECAAPEATVLARLTERERQGTSVSDGRAALYPLQKAAFGPIVEVPPDRHWRADTSLPPAVVLASLLGAPGLRIPEPLFTLPPAPSRSRARASARDPGLPVPRLPSETP